MEALFGFLAGLLFTWPAMILLVLIAIGTEHNRSHGWTVVVTLGLGFIAYKVFGLTLTQVGIGAAAWIPIGLIWSFWRWKRYVDSVVDSFSTATGNSLNIARDKIDTSNNIDKITYWVIAWPFSIVEMALSDVIDAVQTLVKKVFRGTYARISTNGLARLEEKANK